MVLIVLLKQKFNFVNTHLFTDEKWETKNPITLSDDRFGLVKIRAFGTDAYRIKDAGKLIIYIVGTIIISQTLR